LVEKKKEPTGGTKKMSRLEDYLAQRKQTKCSEKEKRHGQGRTKARKKEKREGN